MKLPISFNDFKNNPIASIAFLLVIVVGYLYIDNKTVHKELLNDHKARIEKLEGDIKEYQVRLDEVNQKLLECLGISQQ